MDFLSQAHLISYDYDRDLLSLVLAHCSYSLEAGSGAKIEYDFPSLERELINRYFSGKPSIKFKVNALLFLRLLTTLIFL